MKNFRIIFAAILIAGLGLSGLAAQSSENSSLRGMSFNGATGLFSIPTGQIGFGSPTDVGLDLGYHAIINGGKATSIPMANVSLFKLVELSAAIDLQPDNTFCQDKGTDFLSGIKVQLPITSTNLALGGNFQSLNFNNDHSANRYSAGQIYLAVTYPGNFFSWPAETTMVVGKTFCNRDGYPSWDFDYGMGFDLVILPQYLNKFVHWVTDFGNFSYSVEAFGADPYYRGVLNTGLRIDLSQIPVLSKFKAQVDVLVTDVFDDNSTGYGVGGRSFSIGAMFGLPIM